MHLDQVHVLTQITNVAGGTEFAALEYWDLTAEHSRGIYVTSTTHMKLSETWDKLLIFKSATITFTIN